MLTTRIIPCLDVEDGRVVKGTGFKEIQDAGDPLELSKEYYSQGADEMTFLDIGATYKSKQTLLNVVEKIAKVVFIPLTVGGGIRSCEDIRQALLAGADKVSICSAAIKNPELLKEAASIFGSQCIVLSVDAKRVGDSWNCFVAGGRVDTGLDVFSWVKQAIDLGAGEILLNSIDADGTNQGYDLELTQRVSKISSVPVIASGGAGKLEHFVEGVNIGNADALLLASLLHYKKLTIPQIKNYLTEQGLNIRQGV